MECRKCNIDIPSQFEFALSKNMCPKCGNKLMTDGAMKIYIELKKRLGEVEFVMDKVVVCERIAMFLINNYEILPLNTNIRDTSSSTTEKIARNKDTVESFRAKLATLENEDVSEVSDEEIRAEEAARAEEIALAREMGLDADLDPDEEVVTGLIDANKVQRLKKLAMTGQQVGVIKRVSP